jgi:hypothetical protein
VNLNQAVAGFDSSHQNQRGALAILNGVLYVPYGGHLGDCGAYHGYVVGVPIGAPATVTAWSTGSIGMMPSYKGGIWAAGGISSDGTNLYVSTGNTSTNMGGGGNIFNAPGVWSGGEAVFRLGAGPTFSSQTADYYYPSNWAALDNADLDLGGANPVPFDVADTHYVVALGKDGNLYLLSGTTLGGMGTQLSTTPVANGAIIGAPAVYTTALATYVAFRGTPRGCPAGQGGGSLGVVKIVSGSAPAVAWCANQSFGSPMVTKAGNGDVVVWNANGRLYGYDGDTGAIVFGGGTASDAMASAMQFMNTPIGAGNNRIAVATPGHLYVFHP